MRSAISRFGLRLSVIVTTENHIDPDLEKRARGNQYFQNTIELAGALGVPYVGTASGTMPGKNLNEQVQEIVRVYNEKYFPLCQKHQVRILWEPWAGGPNNATRFRRQDIRRSLEGYRDFMASIRSTRSSTG